MPLANSFSFAQRPSAARQHRSATSLSSVQAAAERVYTPRTRPISGFSMASFGASCRSSANPGLAQPQTNAPLRSAGFAQLASTGRLAACLSRAGDAMRLGMAKASRHRRGNWRIDTSERQHAGNTSGMRRSSSTRRQALRDPANDARVRSRSDECFRLVRCGSRVAEKAARLCA